MHAQRIVDVYEYLRKQPEIIKIGFRAPGISEAVEFPYSLV